MTKRIVGIALTAALLAVVGARVWAVRSANTAPGEAVSDEVVVRTGRVVRRDLVERLAVTGTVRPRNEVEVYPKIGGRLESVEAQVGDRVQKGQVLARVEHKELDWQVRLTEAQAETARAGALAAEAGVAGAKLELERTETLAAGGSAPPAALDGARIKLQAATAQLAQARAGVAQAEAGLGLVRQHLASTVIEAPISGTVVRRAVNPGAMVGQQVALFTLQDTAALKLEAAVDAATFARLQRGTPAEVWVDDRPGELFRGRVEVLSPTLDSASRRASVEVLIENPRGKLLPNMFARGGVVVGSLPGALAVPREAVNEAPGGALVYRVRSRMAEAVHPSLGPVDGAWTAVLDGLEEGDEVVLGTPPGLADGAAVRVAAAAVGQK